MPFSNNSDFNAAKTPLKRSQFTQSYFEVLLPPGGNNLIITEDDRDIITESGDFLETE